MNRHFRIEYSMATRQKKNSRLKGFIVPLICLLLSAYFLHHALNGRFGLYSRMAADDQILHLEFRLAELRKARTGLSHRVSLLRQGSIEKDMLDEQARYHLSLSHPDEIILMR